VKKNKALRGFTRGVQNREENARREEEKPREKKNTSMKVRESKRDSRLREGKSGLSKD